VAKAKKHKPYSSAMVAPPTTGPKVLLFDIETAPIIAHVWSLWENNVALNQIETDWHVMSWSAKWLDDPPEKTMYMDQRGAPDISDDTSILEGIWDLLDQADVVISQNGKNFDQKKLFARFILQNVRNGHPPSHFKHEDTKIIASNVFGFTSNKLEYMTDKLCVKYKKLKHTKFPGHTMWTECLADNLEAWKEMEKYNKYDVLSLEELYYILFPWSNKLNYNIYRDGTVNECLCGSKTFIKNGFYYGQSSKFQIYKCKGCGAPHRDKTNLFDKEKRDSLTVAVPKN